MTATGGSKASFLRAFPKGATQPGTANVLFGPGQTVPNLVTVGIGADNSVSIFNQLGSVNVIADVVGYYDPSTGGRFNSITPARLLDSRTNVGGWNNTKLGNNANRTLTVALPTGLPAAATGIVTNTTVTGGTTASFLAAAPNPTVPNTTANLLFGPGQTVPNAVVVGIGTANGVRFYNQQGSVHVIVDVAGFFT